VAQARLGNFKDAEVLLAQTPQNCDICLRTRAVIAAIQNQSARADALFAAAVQHQPEAPFAYADWGLALLARGDTAGAIAKLKQANQRGPRFADPIEVWGEALMRQGEFSSAAAKFTAANVLAPQWGRSHLRLGQALLKLGNGNAARKEFALASTLDLSMLEKSELGGLHVTP
jgi:tetratricopeptide (TPR) repeat protein